VRQLVLASGAHRPHPYAAAWRALQRRAVALGQLQCGEDHGLALARQFAMLSYRTPEEFGERFDAAPEVINGRVRVAAEDYLDAAGAQYVARTPVTAYLRLSESIDLHRVDPTAILPPTVVVAVEGDRLGAAGRPGRPGRRAGPARQPARAALALWPRRLPQRNRSHRRDPRHRLPHFWRVRMSLHANEPSCSRTTAAVRAGIDRDTAHGAVTPPIVLSSNFSFEGFGNKRQYDYTRSGNPTRDLLGEALAELEGGAGGVITATGMGAINLVLNALLQPGDTLVVPHDAYGGSWRLFNALAKKGHFELVTADLTDPRALAQALATQPKLVLVETRPTRCCASPTCASSSMPRTRPVRWWWSTTPSCRRRCSSRCRSARTWCCIPPPSTSMATAMWSVVRWSRAIRRCTSSWCGGATRWA
jgi:hypothetical protein